MVPDSREPGIRQKLAKMGMPKRLSLALIPLVLALVIILAVLNVPIIVVDPPYLLLILNTVFIGITSIIIAYVTGRVFKKQGSVSVFLIGSGLLIIGLGSIVSGWFLPLTGGVNLNVTIHNTCACAGSLVILAGSLAGNSGLTLWREERRIWAIVAAWCGILVFVTLFSLATLQGLTPVFFIQGIGATPLRQIVLENTLLFFAVASALMMFAYFKRQVDFFYWYSVSFALIAIGLCAILFQSSVGSLIGWVGRSIQYLGFVVALYAVLAARRTVRGQGHPLEDVIASFFADAESSYKMLVEAANDAIVTIDNNDRILLWNPAAERLFGYTYEEAIGSSFTELAVSYSSIMVFKNSCLVPPAHDSDTGCSHSFEIVGKHKNGTLIPVESSCSWRRNAGILTVICILHDLTERKRSQEALRTSEEKYRTVAEFTYDWEFWVNPDGQIVYLSPAAERILGRSVSTYSSLEELLRDVVLPEDLDMRLAHLADEKAGGEPFEMEYRIIRPGGEVRWLHHVCQPVYSSDGRFLGTRGSNRDITERKWAEDLLRKSEEQLHRAFEDAVTGMAIVAPDGRFLKVNHAFTSMLGYTEEELLKKSFREITSPEDLEENNAHVDATIAGTQHIIRMEKRYLHKDGRVVWVIINSRLIRNAEGRPVHFITQVLDITHRKLAEEALQRIAAIVEYSDNAIIGKTLDGTITSWNAGAERMYGYSAQEMIGKNISLLVPPDLLDDTVKILERVRNGDAVIRYETRRRKKDGGQIVVSLTVSPIKDAHNNLIGASVITYDLTERKRLEAALRAANESLEAKVRERTAALERTTRAYRVLSECNQFLVRTSDEHELTNGVCKILVTVGGYRCAWIGYAHHDKDKPVEPVAWSGCEQDYLKNIRFSWKKGRHGNSPTGTAIRTGKPVVERDIPHNPKCGRWISDAIQREYSTVAAFPFILHKNVIGALTIFAREPEAFDSDELQLLLELTNDLTYGIESVRTTIEHGKAEETLRESNAYLNTLIDYANAPIITWDTAFSITRFNPAFEHLSGRRAVDVLGKPLDVLFPDKSCIASMASIQKTLEGERWATVEIPILTAEGSTKTVLWNSANILDSHGNLAATIAQGVDITERKRAEAERELALRKLALMTDVTYQDIQNKVTAIRGYTELMRDVATQRERTAFLDKMESVLATIQDLINKTKDYQKMGESNNTWIPIENEIRMQVMHISGIKNISIDINLHGLEWYTDPQINRVFYNLIDNAVKHGKTVTRIAFSCHKTDDGILLVCEDDGAGIPVRDKGRIFDRIVSGKGKFGLFFVRGFLEMTGASIRETGEPGKGSRFEITIPKGMYRFSTST
jgi:PAS domain S-box-containing protein